MTLPKEVQEARQFAESCKTTDAECNSLQPASYYTGLQAGYHAALTLAALPSLSREEKPDLWIVRYGYKTDDWYEGMFDYDPRPLPDEDTCYPLYRHPSPLDGSQDLQKLTDAMYEAVTDSVHVRILDTGEQAYDEHSVAAACAAVAIKHFSKD